MKYILHLQKDKRLATILGEEVHQLVLHKNIPLRLISSIMSQQLSTKVAAVIFKRFLEIFNGEEPSPQQILDTPLEILRAIGLSNNKVRYIQNVAAFCIEHAITDTKLLAMSNEEIIDLLVQIKGVGQWTVEMLLMFSLGREDVFAVDDLGIQQGMQRLYSLDTTNKKLLKAQMLELSQQWKPYRSYACLHIWKWKDDK
jgi:DNA-3-methyladenine glycosylase II